MQTIGLIDGTARLREFVAAYRERGLMVVHDQAAARDDRAPNGLPEAYWAPVTTVMITQSSLGAALAVAWHRFLVLRAVVGAAMPTYVGPHAVAFGIGLFVLGLIRIVTHSDLTGYRFGGVALAIVLEQCET